MGNSTYSRTVPNVSRNEAMRRLHLAATKIRGLESQIRDLEQRLTEADNRHGRTLDHFMRLRRSWVYRLAERFVEWRAR